MLPDSLAYRFPLVLNSLRWFKNYMETYRTRTPTSNQSQPIGHKAKYNIQHTTNTLTMGEGEWEIPKSRYKLTAMRPCIHPYWLVEFVHRRMATSNSCSRYELGCSEFGLTTICTQEHPNLAPTLQCLCTQAPCLLKSQWWDPWKRKPLEVNHFI